MELMKNLVTIHFSYRPKKSKFLFSVSGVCQNNCQMEGASWRKEVEEKQKSFLEGVAKRNVKIENIETG